MNLIFKDCDLTISSSSAYRIGVIAGGLRFGLIYNCGVSGSLTYTGTGTTEAVGGIVATVVEDDAIIEKCYSAVNVTSSDSTVGCFAGKNYGMIKNSYATGTVSYGGSSTNSKESFGGFVGIAGGQISNCYATGAVQGDTKVGGFVGTIAGSSYSSYYLKNCYSSGAVSGNGSVAGFASTKSTYGSNTVSNNYYNSTAAGCSSSYASDIDLASQSAFSGFDFDSTWSIDSSINGGMPYLTGMP